MVKKIQERKAGSVKAQVHLRAKNMPKDPDSPPAGFGKHLRRRGFREISFVW